MNSSFKISYVAWLGGCCRTYELNFLKCEYHEIIFAHPRKLERCQYENDSYIVSAYRDKSYIYKKDKDTKVGIKKFDAFISIEEIENYLLFL